MYKEDSASNNQQQLICHKAQPNQSYIMFLCVCVYIYIYVYKVADCCQGQPDGSLFNSYYTEV